MNRFLQFAGRFHKLKDDLVGLEELEFGRVVNIEAGIRQSWVALEDEKDRAQAAQNSADHLSEWSAYELYRKALQQRQMQVELEWNDAKRQVDAQQERLRLAFVDEKTWSRIVERTAAEVSAEQSRRIQTEADEDAMRRFGKADL